MVSLAYQALLVSAVEAAGVTRRVVGVAVENQALRVPLAHLDHQVHLETAVKEDKRAE